MKLALSMLCENPDRRTGLSTLFHEFVAHALVERPDVEWVLFAGPDQPWAIDDPRVEVVRRFPANDRPWARLVADHLRVAPEARRRGADALLTVGFAPLRSAGLPVVMHVFSVHHLRAGGGLRMAYRRWAMRRGLGRARLVIANSWWTAAQLAAAYRVYGCADAVGGGAHTNPAGFGLPVGSAEVGEPARHQGPNPAGFGDPALHRSTNPAGFGDPALHQTTNPAGIARSTSSASRSDSALHQTANPAGIARSTSSASRSDPALHQAGGGPELAVSYEGVQHERFRPEGARGREDLPREYLLWSSNFYRYKRVELALAAYAALPRATRTRFPLVLAGGDWHGGRGRAEAAARRLGIQEQVRWLGWVSDEELPNLYRGARALVLSTEEETFGRSVTEAMACGCPCVLQDLPVLREVTGGAAVFVDFARPASAAAELERVCTDDARAAGLREAGLRRAAAFSFATLTRERLDAIGRAVGRRPTQVHGSPFTVHSSERAASAGPRFNVPGSRLEDVEERKRGAATAPMDGDPARQPRQAAAHPEGSPYEAAAEERSRTELGGASLSRHWIAAAVCALAGAAVFQFFGNANHGYIQTDSLFWWWGWQWWNPASETQHGWLILALAGWLLARALRREDATVEARGERREESRNAECGTRKSEDREIGKLGNNPADSGAAGSAASGAGRGSAFDKRGAPGDPGRQQTPNPAGFGDPALHQTTDAAGFARSTSSASRSDPALHQRGADLCPLAALAGGLALHAAGFAAQQARVSILALLLFTWGVLRLGGGRRWGAAAAFPLAFLVFAIPVNVLDSVGFWLRLGVVHASAALAHAAGIGVIENGTQLVAPDGRYQYDVAAACSGVRSLMALAALSLLIGYLNFRGWGKRLLMLLVCFPLVFVGNVARITAIIFAAQAGGPRWGDVAHAVMGWAIFAIVLGGVLGAGALLRRVGPEERREARGERREDGGWRAHEKEYGNDRAESQTRRGDRLRRMRAGTATRAYMIAGVVLVLAAGEMLFLHRLAQLPPAGRAGVALAADGRDPVELPAILGPDWVGLPAAVTPVERAILPPDTGYSRMVYVSSRAPRRVFLSIVLSGRDRTSIHRPELCLLGQGWTIQGRATHRFVAPGGGAFRCTVLRVVHRGAGGGPAVPQLVAYWFVGDDRVVASYWRRLAWDAWYRVVHARADRWAYVLLQTDAADGEPAALARMQQVLDRTLPVFEPIRQTTNKHEETRMDQAPGR